MFNSTVLDVAVGLIFTFLAMSLAVSAIVEGLASILRWRSNTLLQGVKDLLNDPNLSGLALKIYNDALVNPRDQGRAKSGDQLKNLPAYINPQHFADALIDAANLAKTAPDKIADAINQNQFLDDQMKTLLTGMANRASGDLNKVRENLAAWFDNAMDRVSGVYKRRTQVWSFLFAVVLAIGLNINSVGICKTLWQQPMLAKTIAPQADLDPAEALQKLDALGVPIGWTEAKFKDLATWNGLEQVAGWLLTAAATLFGAPFWFDALERIIRLKGSGPSPAEKRSGMGAAA